MHAKRQGKTPKAGLEPAGGKRPSIAADPEAAVRDEYVSWRMAIADLGGPWSWRNVAPDKLDKIHQKLCDYEKLTVGEIMRMQGTTPIPVEQICSDAQKRLREIGQDDDDTLWHLRLQGEWRIWGKFRGQVFQLLWWDPEHTVQPYQKPRT